MAVIAKVNGTKVVTGQCRCSYAHFFVPNVGPSGGDAKYSTMLLIPKSDKKTIAAIESAIDTALEAGKASLWKGKVPPTLRRPMRDGDAEHPDDPVYEGMYFINVNSKKKPGVVDADMNEILDPTALVSGDYVRCSINAYPYEVSGNKGITFGLENVQLLAKGIPLGGRGTVESDFGVVELAEEEF